MSILYSWKDYEKKKNIFDLFNCIEILILMAMVVGLIPAQGKEIFSFLFTVKTEHSIRFCPRCNVLKLCQQIWNGMSYCYS